MNSTGIVAGSGNAMELLATYEQQSPAGGQHALATLLAALQNRHERDWLECVQHFVLRGRAGEAQQLLASARAVFPASTQIAFAFAGLQASAGRDDAAEALLCDVLARDPAHAAAALLLAEVLRKQARMTAAAHVLRACFVPRRHSAELLIRALELLDDCGRKGDAAALAQDEIAAGCDDPRIHAYAATYLIQLGEFARARERYLFAYLHSPHAPEWEVPFGLASTQRYRDPDHADFGLFQACLGREDLSPRARATLLFAMGKAFADVGDFATAARHLAQANDIGRVLWPWSRKQWRRGIDARMQAARFPARTQTRRDFVPVFVVGVPRSGTTLVAELLARYPQVCNRGESHWIWSLSQRLPPGKNPEAALLDTLAREYERQLRQDDAADARWFVDKQPLNVLHVGFIMAMFPNARIVYCRRGARDTALSLWMQYFREPGYGFAYDFADIAALQQGCERMMAYWLKQFPDAIRTLQYEDLVADPLHGIAALADWIGLGSGTPVQDGQPAPINTASVWQARQPVYSSSVGRWREWERFVPELLQFSGA
jgi:hypothetical protein